jgi:hypothetical protein
VKQTVKIDMPFSRIKRRVSITANQSGGVAHVHLDGGSKRDQLQVASTINGVAKDAGIKHSIAAPAEADGSGNSPDGIGGTPFDNPPNGTHEKRQNSLTSTIEYDPAKHGNYPRPGPPSGDELNFVRSVSSQFDGEEGFEYCALICESMAERLGTKYELSNIRTDRSHFACDTSPLACPEGTKLVADIHNHPAPGAYTVNAADVMFDDQLSEGQQIYFSSHGFSVGRYSDTDSNASQKINGWLILNGKNRILYFDHSDRLPFHQEFIDAPE